METQKENWDHYSDLPSPLAYENEYQDILSTEDCVLDALEKFNADNLNEIRPVKHIQTNS
jgi:hypothetical protein